MKSLKIIYAALFAYFLLFAAPAFAQFEVSPDHFDQPATANKNTTSAKKPQNRTNQVHQAASSTRKKQSVAGTRKPLPATTQRQCKLLRMERIPRGARRSRLRVHPRTRPA